VRNRRSATLRQRGRSSNHPAAIVPVPTGGAAAIHARNRSQMTGRMVFLATAILSLAAPAATAARDGRPAEAIITLHRLGSTDWQLDIENATPASATITQVIRSAPVGLKVERIVRSSKGTCSRSSGGFRCKTLLEAPYCPTCTGDRLTIDFKGTAARRHWVRTSSGGYWAQHAMQSGHATLIAS
jgi:hypothetical protein